MSAAELAWLASALRQPGYKLPGFDENGDPVRAETIVTCLELGLIEPWVPGGGDLPPKVCRLTEKGEVIAESHLLGAGAPLRPEAPLDDLIDEASEESEALSAWWEELPGAYQPEAGGGPAEAAEELPPLPRAAAARRPAPRAEETHRRRYQAEGDEDSAPREPLSPAEERLDVFAGLRQRLSAPAPTPWGRDLLRATLRFGAATGLLALGFALGWSIDPPSQRTAGDRIAIVSERADESGTGDGGERPPRLEDILSLEPAAGPGDKTVPGFMAPLQDAPDSGKPAPSPRERLPAMEDPLLMERWDRVEAAPPDREPGAEGPRYLANYSESAPEGAGVERIVLPGRPLSHSDPRYAESGASESLYRVEMAAFAQADLAEAAKAALQRSHADLLSGERLSVARDSASVGAARYRVVADPLALETAEHLCSALRRRGQGCQVIPLESAALFRD